jgi:hypothetical protein
MEIELIRSASQQIYFPEIGIIKDETGNGEESHRLGDYILTFNGFTNREAYTDYVWSLIENIEKEIKNNIKKASSRLKALYYIKQLKLNIKKCARSFSESIDNGLEDYEQVLYDHLKASKKKMPSEFQNLKEVKLNRNKNVSHSEELSELIKSEHNHRQIYRFESDFVSVQIAMAEELEMMIDTYESFIENVSVEDFNNKDEFFEIDFSTVTLSDSVKLTDKKVNMKIDTLDIRQSALLFDYLEKAKLILPYNNKDKAYFTHYLTGHAQEKLRTEKGFGMIEAIRKDKEKPKKFEDVRFYNLKTVRNELNRLVRLINKDIDRFSEK